MSELSNELNTGTAPGRQTPTPAGISSSWYKLLDIEDVVFTERRIRLYGSVMLVTWAIVLGGFFLQGGWIIGHDGKLGSLDFCWIWLTGKFAISSDPARIYDPSVLAAAHDIYYRPGECVFIQMFDYPPTLLFLTYPLGHMPFLVGFTVWVGATLALYLTAVYKLIPSATAIIFALAPWPVFTNILLGHNGFLTAGLVGLSLALLKRRPWLSGIFLALLTYKPQFGVLFPFALLASRAWSVLVSAAVATAALGLGAGLAFDFQAWPSFIGSLFHRNSGLSADMQYVLKLHSVYGLLHGAGASAWVSWAAHLTVAGAMTLAVCVIWAKPIPHSLKAAALCVGSLMVSPYLLAYDLCSLSIAAAFFIADGISRGFLPGERTALLICYAGLFLLLTPTLPVVPIICVILLVLVARRIVTYGPRASDTSPHGNAFGGVLRSARAADA